MIARSVRGSVVLIGLVVFVLGGCQSTETAVSPAIPLFRSGHLRAEGVDPARTPHHGWKPVDAAVSGAAMEMLIIARPGETEGVTTRNYTLRTLKGQPGELVVTRRGVGLGIEPSDGLTLECRLGRHGLQEHEKELIERIQAALVRQHAIEHEGVDY